MSQEQNTSVTVLLNSAGLPFDSVKAAQHSMRLKELSPEVYEVAAYESGFGIYPKGLAPKEPVAEVAKPKIKPNVEKFWKLQFAPKGSPNDTEDVVLSVNGDVLVMQREVEVVLPDRYRVCADNARVVQYQQRPGEQRKIVGSVRTYPYMVSGEASEEEYVLFKNKGNQMQKDYMERMANEGAPSRA